MKRPFQYIILLCILTAILPVSGQACLDELQPFIEGGLKSRKIAFREKNPDAREKAFQDSFKSFRTAIAMDCQNWLADSVLASAIYQEATYLLWKQVYIDSAVSYYKTAAEIYQRYLSGNDDRLFRCYTNIGKAKRIQFDFEAAEAAFHKGKSSIDRGGSPCESGCAAYMGDFHREWGNLYIQQGQLHEALIHTHIAEKYYRNANRKEDLRYLIGTLIQLGEIYDRLNSSENAIRYFEQASQLATQSEQENIPGNWQIHIQNCERNIGTAYKNWGRFDISEGYHRKSLAAAQNPVEKARIYGNLGLLYLERGAPGRALQIFTDSVAIGLPEVTSRKARIKVAQHYDNVGDAFRDLSEFDSALFYYQQATVLITENFANLTPLANPNLQGLSLIGSKRDFIKLVSSKAHTFYLKYKQSGDAQDLQAAHETYALALDVIDQFRNEFQQEDSKLFLQRESQPTYEGAIQVALEMGNKELAFEIAERAKGNLLYAAVQRNEAMQFASSQSDQFQELLRQEYLLKQQIAQIEHQLNNMALADSAYEPAMLDLNRLKVDLAELVRRFEEENDAYYRLKYDTSPPDLTTLQRNLPSKTSILKYFAGKDTWYVFAISRNDIFVHQSPRDPSRIQTLVDLMSTETAMAEAAAIDRYAQSSYQLYKDLVAPVVDYLGDHVIIIPDAKLNYLSFEALLTEMPAEGGFLKDYPYWLKTKAVSYASSAKLWLYTVQRPQPFALFKKNLMAFAPDFHVLRPESLPQQDRSLLSLSFFTERAENDTLNLPELDYTAQEVMEIQDLLGGVIYPKQDPLALLGRFIQQSDDYRFIHFATHGIFQKENELYSYLAFQPVNDQVDNERLYLADLYRLKLRAEMVVLSACETQVGEWHPGEGIASLAQGFTYAGARSIVATLWSVQNESNYRLMVAYYQLLDQGHDKAEALRQAKLSLLENYGNQFGSPYYWAAPVALGDTRPVSFTALWIKYAGFGLMVLLILLGLYFLMNKRSSIRRQTAS